jgi:transposase
MQPNPQRRVHGAEFREQVLAECQQPGVSVAAVALAHRLNVNLVRKWLIGCGLKRAGLMAPRTVARSQPSDVTAIAPALSSCRSRSPRPAASTIPRPAATRRRAAEPHRTAPLQHAAHGELADLAGRCR